MTTFGMIFFFLLTVGISIFIIKDTGEYFASIFGSIVISLAILFIFACFGDIGIKREKDTKFKLTYISSLSVNSNISGSFCLGSGNIGETNYYYYVSNSEFGYKISKIETDNVYIKEDCKSKPFIEYSRYKCVHQNWFISLFFNKQFNDKDGEIIIHVPQNTVVKNYNVDISKL